MGFKKLSIGRRRRQQPEASTNQYGGGRRSVRKISLEAVDNSTSTISSKGTSIFGSGGSKRNPFKSGNKAVGGSGSIRGSGGSNSNGVPISPHYETESAAPQPLPPLGLSPEGINESPKGTFFGIGFVEDQRDDNLRGSLNNSLNGTSLNGDSVFDGLPNRAPENMRASPTPGVPTRYSRDPRGASTDEDQMASTSTDRKKSRNGGSSGKQRNPFEENYRKQVSERQVSQRASKRSGRGEQPSGLPSTGMPQDPPAEAKEEDIDRQGSSLRAAMQKEISKHRVSSQGHPSPVASWARSSSRGSRASQTEAIADTGMKNSARNGAVIGAAMAAAGVAGTTVKAHRKSPGSQMKLSMTRHKQRTSYGSEDFAAVIGRTAGSTDGEGAEFPDQRAAVEDEDGSMVDAGSYLSCGDPFGGDEGDDLTYDRDESLRKSGTYDDDEASIDSYMDEASYTSYLSYDDEVSKKSLDPPGTWADWFGFGGEKEMKQEDSVYSSRSGATDGDTYEGGESVDDDSEGDKAREIAKAAAKSKSGVKDAPGETHDREGRPMVLAGTAAAATVAVAAGTDGASVGSAKPLVKMSSFRNKLKSLKPPLSPGGKSRGGDNKSVATEVTQASTAGSTKSASKKEGKNKNKGQWDDDDRQRDIYCAQHGDIENLMVRQYAKVPVPAAPDHILVKVEASTVSSKDCYVRLMGDLNDRPNPAVPGFYIVGTVDSLGSNVNAGRIREGDRIAALLPNGGGNAKYASIPFNTAVKLPETAEHEDIICLVANYMTAYQCLKLAKKDGAPLTNANVLITGGSGPVGQAMVELALREGAKVFATAHKMHEEHLTKLGAKWFAVKPKKWLPYLEGKMDVVIDSLCVDGYESSYQALTHDGILVCNTGNSNSLLRLQNDPAFCNAFEDNNINTWWSEMKARYIWNRALFYDLNVSFEANPRMFAHELHYLICKLERGEINPKVAGRVSLNQVPKAQKLIEKGLPNGTVVCLPWKKLDPKQKVKVKKLDGHS